jgi:hypothetical protein
MTCSHGLSGALPPAVDISRTVPCDTRSVRISRSHVVFTILLAAGACRGIPAAQAGPTAYEILPEATTVDRVGDPDAAPPPQITGGDTTWIAHFCRLTAPNAVATRRLVLLE